MASTQNQWIQCPFCGTTIELVIDCSVSFQKYIEDCEVCCRPINLSVTVNGDGEIFIDAQNENET